MQIDSPRVDCIPGASAADDPLSYCLNNTIGRSFYLPPLGTILSPQSKQCNLYMGQYCARNWDCNCDTYEKINPYLKCNVDMFNNCKFEAVSTEPFDPTNPASPNMLIPHGRMKCNPPLDKKCTPGCGCINKRL